MENSILKRLTEENCGNEGGFVEIWGILETCGGIVGELWWNRENCGEFGKAEGNEKEI